MCVITKETRRNEIKYASKSVVMFYLYLLLYLAKLQVIHAATQEEGGSHGSEEEEEPALAVLFPWFTEMIGVVVFLMLTRYVHALPYTAVMFLLGTFMGLGAARLERTDQLTESILMWDVINSEVLLLVFLPGLIFRDAFGLNVHLLQVSLSQILTMAFPMVLAGTTLTALVAFYVFPYNWSFSLCMTFGSILSATDPVAVSALLNEVGAPPRLKMHISGESLFNDGSSIVFFTIFGAMFLSELGIFGELGETITVGEGFALFFRMALGGAAVGIAFGIANVLFLFFLDRRLDREENVVQVAATVTVAYLTYYTADVTARTSGVIAVVCCGIITKAFGWTMINDKHMMDSFWVLVEHLLNTLLFALGGVVWGGTISNAEERAGMFVAQDWGYLILLYVLMMAIRFFLVFSFYPIISRIGLKTNWQESVFMSFGGLRGAVGIALAISLDNQVWSSTDNVKALESSTILFGMVGGVAFMTLLINGTLSGPLLRKLGLADSTKLREKVVESYTKTFEQNMLDDFIHLLADPRFHDVDFSVVRYHVFFLKDLTAEEFQDAIERNKDNVPASQYQVPHAECVLPYLQTGSLTSDYAVVAKGNDEGAKNINSQGDEEQQQVPTPGASLKAVAQSVAVEESMPTEENMSPELKERVVELRKLFIEVLRYAYEKQIEKGELDGRLGFVAYVLLQGLEFASDAVSRGKPLDDWQESEILDDPWANRIDLLVTKALYANCFCTKELRRARAKIFSMTYGRQQLRVNVIRALAFIDAHQLAQGRLEKNLCGAGGKFCGSGDDFTEAKTIVLNESKAQVAQAEQLLHSENEEVVKSITSHFLCIILLNKAARYIESLVPAGLLKEREAGEFIEQIQHQLNGVYHCTMFKHPSKLSDSGTL